MMNEAQYYIERVKAEKAYYESRLLEAYEIFSYTLNLKIELEITHLKRQIEALDTIIAIHQSTCTPFLDRVGQPFYDWFTENYAKWINSDTSFKIVNRSFLMGVEYRELDYGNMLDEFANIITFKFCRYLYEATEYLIATNEQANAIRLVSQGSIYNNFDENLNY